MQAFYCPLSLIIDIYFFEGKKSAEVMSLHSIVSYPAAHIQFPFKGNTAEKCLHFVSS